MIPAVELRGVTKDFVAGPCGFRLRAVDAVDLEISPGVVFGLLGPNGCGKTTVIKLILGLVVPTRGECRIFGALPGDPETRCAVGYLPDAPYFHRFLTGRELVAFHGGLSGLRGKDLRARVEEVVATVGLAEAADRRIEGYSKGMLQRIGLAQALVHRPRLVILDEPTAGLDEAGAEAIMNHVRSLRTQGVTVLLTSHIREHVAAICDQTAVLEFGRVVRSGVGVLAPA